MIDRTCAIQCVMYARFGLLNELEISIQYDFDGNQLNSYSSNACSILMNPVDCYDVCNVVATSNKYDFQFIYNKNETNNVCLKQNTT